MDKYATLSQSDDYMLTDQFTVHLLFPFLYRCNRKFLQFQIFELLNNSDTNSLNFTKLK